MVMDESYEEESNKICFILHNEVYENLNVLVNKTYTLTVFWNSYQIFVFNNFKYNEPPNIFIPEFYVENVTLTNNYLICLDNNGNVHLTPLKFKISTSKRFKCCFQPREQSVIGIQSHKEITVTLKYVSNICYICNYKIDSEFKKVSEVKLLFETPSLFYQKKLNIFLIYLLTEFEYNEIKDFYKVKEIWNQHLLIFISFDKLNVYSFLYNTKSTDDVMPIKLYTSPSEIVHTDIIHTNNLNALFCLDIGTIIKIPLTNLTNDLSVVHLNASIYKLIPINDTMIYTDGNIMWKSEKTFTENVKFIKCFVQHIKDFVIIDNKILCTTFTNLIYFFSIEDESLFEKLVPCDIYCPAEKVLNDSESLLKIMAEVDKSNQIIKTIKKEEEYITTLSLANRHDVMDNVIIYNACVYTTLADITKQDLTLINFREQHYYQNVFFFLISIETKPLSEKFYDILSNMFGELRIHLDFNVNKKNIKTVSINVKGHLKNSNIVVPLDIIDDLHKVTIDIKLVKNIPGMFIPNENIWTVLHKKRAILNSEHFIKSSVPLNSTHSSTNNSKCISDAIYDTIVNQYGHLYRFNRLKSRDMDWSLYVTPFEECDYKDNSECLMKHFSNRNVELIKQITCKEFLKSKREIFFTIGSNQVKLQIINDGFTKPLLKVSCEKLEIAFHIRNFLAQYIYNDFTGFGPGKQFINHSLYYTIEILEKRLKDSINALSPSQEEFMKLFDEYQMNVIGTLPI